jgi:hypothetical protein
MALSTLFWRPVNLFRSREIRAWSKHTSIWGLGRIHKKSHAYSYPVVANIKQRTLTGNLPMEQAAKLPLSLICNRHTHWETVALFLAALPEEKKGQSRHPDGSEIKSRARLILNLHRENKDKIMERLKLINVYLYYALEERTSGGQPDQPLY